MVAFRAVARAHPASGEVPGAASRPLLYRRPRRQRRSLGFARARRLRAPCEDLEGEGGVLGEVIDEDKSEILSGKSGWFKYAVFLKL